MKTIILLICLIILNLSATDFSKYKNGVSVNLKISYLNMNNFKLKDKLVKDRFFLKTFITNNPITLLSNFEEKNIFDYLSTPTNIIYNSKSFYNKNNYSALFENNNINEFTEIQRILFLDNKRLFEKNIISGYLINMKYIIFVFNFSNLSDKKEIISNIKKINEVIKWSRKYFYVDKKNIALIGYFGLSYSALQNKIYGFSPKIKYPNKIIKYNNKYRMTFAENILLTNDSNFKARSNLFIRNKLLNGKYKNDIKSYIEKVSPYYPMNLYIMNFKLNN